MDVGMLHIHCIASEFERDIGRTGYIILDTPDS